MDNIPTTRPRKKNASDQPDQVILYYNDGSYKKPAANPLGSARAGAGIVKCEVEFDENGGTRMKHIYNISLPVVTEKSLKFLKHLFVGANEHLNIVGEWSALAYALKDSLWMAKNNPDKRYAIEIRQDCFEVVDVLLNRRHYQTNVLLINTVRKSWKETKDLENIQQLDIYHLYAHGRGHNADPWNDLAGKLAKKQLVDIYR